MPRFWGSEIRHREPTGILSGLTEGLASFAYGFGDGIGGLVYKPVMGAYEDVSFSLSTPAFNSVFIADLKHHICRDSSVLERDCCVESPTCTSSPLPGLSLSLHSR